MNTYNPNNGSEIPWFEQENVDDYSSAPKSFVNLQSQAHERGYCILETGAKESLIDEVNEGIFNHL